MPKKFTGNTKAEAAKERKDNVKQEQKATQAKARDDAAWADNDPKLLKKQKEKEDAEKAKVEKAARDAEKKRLQQEEDSAAAKAKGPQKVTHYQLQQNLTQRRPQTAEAPKANSVVDNDALTENLNRTESGAGAAATGLDEALAALSASSSGAAVDKHPEKRQAAAHKAFEERMIPELKKENPGLRMSQLKELAWKLWQKSPENPHVQAMIARQDAAMADQGGASSSS